MKSFSKINKVNYPIILTIALLFFGNALFAQNNKNDVLNGVWKSSDNNLKVMVYNRRDVVYAKLVGFPFDHKTKKSMSECLDYLNPEENLRTRSWLGILILTDLKNESENKWTGGEIYNPHDGKTWSASVTLINNNTLEVRGYWGISFIGKSMYFNRELPSTLSSR